MNDTNGKRREREKRGKSEVKRNGHLLEERQASNEVVVMFSKEMHVLDPCHTAKT